eukprot:2755-Heterococcus_DN1.PRE.2
MHGDPDALHFEQIPNDVVLMHHTSCDCKSAMGSRDKTANAAVAQAKGCQRAHRTQRRSQDPTKYVS